MKITAKEALNIAEHKNCITDDNFLKLCDNHIKMSAEQGLHRLDIRIYRVNDVTKDALIEYLTNNGFKLSHDLSKHLLIVEW